ncbi:L10-interacting MYB domain-containing protein-like protein [Tanacetum coccineum]
MALNSDDGELEAVPDPATWSLLEENTFIKIMAKEVQRGNRHSTTFSRSSWSVIKQEFYEKTNRKYNHAQFRNKYNQLRIHYIWFAKMLSESGFTWDPVLRNAVATDDVWESYLKTNKKARRFKKKGCPMYNELVIIFGDTITDYDAHPLAQYPTFKDEKIDLEYESTNVTPRPFPIDNSISSTDTDSQTIGKRRHLSPTPIQTQRLHRNKEPKIAPADEALKEPIKMTVSNKQGSDPVSDRTQTFKNLAGCPEPSSFSITNCVKCLESIQDVDAATYIKAIKLFKDVDWREMFMAMSPQRRRDWLASLE